MTTIDIILPLFFFCHCPFSSSPRLLRTSFDRSGCSGWQVCLKEAFAEVDAVFFLCRISTIGETGIVTRHTGVYDTQGGLSSRYIPALASLFHGAATAQGGDTGHQAALVAAATALVVWRRRLFVLHGGLALGRTILALGGTVLALRRAVLPLGRTVALDDGKKDASR